MESSIAKISGHAEIRTAAEGSISLRADQDAYEELNKNLALQKHVIKAYAVWALPKAPSAVGRVVGYLLNDWQVSGVLTAGSANHVNNDQPGSRYDLTYNSPDRLFYVARLLSYP